MSEEFAQFRTALTSSLRDGEFPAAVLWGALAAGLVAIAEYNLTTLDGGPVVIQYSMFVGGLLAGVLYDGPRESAQKAGAYAAGIPVFVLSPVVTLLWVASGTVGSSLGWILASALFAGLLVVPLVAGFSMLFGALSAHVAHWGVEQAGRHRRRILAA